MDTTTVCFDLVSLFDFGCESLITLGLARVETIKKKSSKMNRMSFRGPVCTSPSSLCLLRKFKKTDFSMRVWEYGSMGVKVFELFTHILPYSHTLTLSCGFL